MNIPNFDNMIVHEKVIKKALENMPTVETDSKENLVFGVRVTTSNFIPENQVLLCAGGNIVAVLDLETGAVRTVDIGSFLEPRPFEFPKPNNDWEVIWRNLR